MLNEKEIYFIGAGKIAHTLVPALIKADYKIAGIISRNILSAKELGAKNSIPLCSDYLGSLPAEGFICFITVPDNEIEETAKKIAALNIKFNESLFVHFSGSINTEALKSLKRKGARTASFHIMQTFPTREAALINGSFAAVETESKTAKNYLLTLARKTGVKPFFIKPEDKVYYHLTGVFISNFLTGNFFASNKLFSRTGENEDVFKEIIKPIFYQTAHNIFTGKIAGALSGPIERGDLQTVKHHITALEKNKPMLASYVSQSLLLIDMLKEKQGALTKEQKRIESFLKKAF